MNTHIESSVTSKRARLASVAVITALVTALAGGPAYAAVSSDALVPAARAVAEDPPPDVDHNRPADRIAEELSTLAEDQVREGTRTTSRFAGRPADRIAEELAAEEAEPTQQPETSGLSRAHEQWNPALEDESAVGSTSDDAADPVIVCATEEELGRMAEDWDIQCGPESGSGDPISVRLR